MTKNEITIDINQMNTEELEQLAQILFRYKDMENVNKIDDRKNWIIKNA